MLWNDLTTTTSPNQSYPWGATSRRYQDLIAAGTITAGTDPLPYSIDNNNDFAGGFFYFYPPVGTGAFPDTIDDGSDFTPYIAAPGRFYMDVTNAASSGVWANEHWFDFGANMFEYETVPLTSYVYTSATAGASLCDTTDNVLATKSGTTYTCPAQYTCMQSADGGEHCGVIRSYLMPTAGWQGYSWEVHTLGKSVNGSSQPIHTQYGKTSFRCARDVEPAK